jgi:hypothetical protein
MTAGLISVHLLGNVSVAVTLISAAPFLLFALAPTSGQRRACTATG